MVLIPQELGLNVGTGKSPAIGTGVDLLGSPPGASKALPCCSQPSEVPVKALHAGTVRAVPNMPWVAEITFPL